jgi:hypothetical protein
MNQGPANSAPNRRLHLSLVIATIAAVVLGLNALIVIMR